MKQKYLYNGVKNKNAGFTLVELIAVMMILILLGLVITPVIKNILTKVRRSTWKETVNELIDASTHYLEQYVIDNYKEMPYPVTFTCDGSYCTNANGVALIVAGEIPDSGTITIAAEDNIYATLVTNGKWCASGYKGRLEVEDSCIKLDHTPPVIIKGDSIVIASTNSKVVVVFPPDMMEDKETGIAKYIINIKKGNDIVDTKIREDFEKNIAVVFNDLEDDTEYNIEIIGVNGNNLETSTNRVVKTKLLSNPIIAYKDTPTISQNSYVKSQTINVSFSSKTLDKPNYYIKSTRKANISDETLASCGVGIIPNECSNSKTNIIEENVWYKVNENIDITYSDDVNLNDILYTMTYNGTEYKNASSSIIAKLDNENPTIKIDNVSVRSDSIVIGYTLYDAKSGIGSYTCKYSENGKTYPNNSSFITKNNCVITDLKDNKTYYYQICTKDRLNNEICETGNTKTVSTNNFILEYENEPLNARNGFVSKQIIKVISPLRGKNNNYYVKLTKEGVINSDTISSCGTGNKPGTCSNNDGNIVVDTWYEVSGNIEIEFESDTDIYGSIIVADYNGNNYVSGMIAKIESSNPTVPEIAGGTGDNWATMAPTIYLTKVGEAFSGVYTYEYLIMSNNNIPTKSFAATGTTDYSVTVSDSGIKYVYFRTVSNALGKSEWSEPQVVRFDNEAPGKTYLNYKSGFSGEAWQNDIEISLSASDNVDISHYEVDINGDGIPDKTVENIFIPDSGVYTKNAKFRAVDYVFNVGEWSDPVIIQMDTEKPTLTNYWLGDITSSNVSVYVQASDNVGMPANASKYVGHNSGVYCVTSTATGAYDNWYWFGAKWDGEANAYRCDITPSTFNHYNQDYLVDIYIIDYAGNGGSYEQLSVSIPGNGE